MNFLNKIFGRNAPDDIWDASRTRDVTAEFLSGDRDSPFDFEMVGESNYQDVLWRAVANEIPEERGYRVEVTAALFREPDNPYDEDAICVRVNGERVGYFPAEYAPDYGDVFDELAERVHAGACAAVIAGGFRLDSGGRAALGIWLDLAEPEHVFEGPARDTGLSAGRNGEAGYYERRHYTEYVEQVKQLKRDSRLDEAVKLLTSLVSATEAEALSAGTGVAPWYYEQLAIVHRKRKDDEAEVAILQRYAGQTRAPGSGAQRLVERLEKVRARIARRSSTG